MDWPWPVAQASRISGRSAWFSMVCGSDSESASTWPSEAISRAKKAKPSFQKRLSRTGFKQIPRAPDRFQVHGVFGIGFDFFTQAPNVNVHAARGNESIRSPHRIEQLIAGKDAVGARSKVIEQPEFERAERHGFPGMAHAIGRRINRQLADLNGARRIGRRFGTAEQGLDARQQFART